MFKNNVSKKLFLIAGMLGMNALLQTNPAEADCLCGSPKRSLCSISGSGTWSQNDCGNCNATCQQCKENDGSLWKDEATVTGGCINGVSYPPCILQVACLCTKKQGTSCYLPGSVTWTNAQCNGCAKACQDLPKQGWDGGACTSIVVAKKSPVCR